MDQDVVKRVKLAWSVAWLGVTGLALAGWGVQAAAIAAAMYLAMSFLAFVVFILNLLLGDAPVALRVLLIALFIVGLLVELSAIASVFGFLQTV